MALTRRADGTGAANRVYAAWWNDFMDLLTGVMADQPVTLGNTLKVNGNTTLNAKTWLNPQTSYGSSFPTITLGIGDNDTGINWVSDGRLQMWSNGIPQLDFSQGSALGFMVKDGGTLRMVHIFIGTGVPVGAVEGDIWIKG